MTWIPVAVTTAGGAGVSAGNASKALVGDFMLLNIHVPTQVSIISATTDITVSAIMGDGSLVSFLVLTNVVTPYYQALQISSVNATGAAGGLVNQVVSGLNVAVAQGNDGVSNVWFDAVALGN